MINLNKVAEELTLAEGLKHQVNIADVKEILRKLFTTLELKDIIKIWFKYNKERR